MTGDDHSRGDEANGKTNEEPSQRRWVREASEEQATVDQESRDQSSTADGSSRQQAVDAKQDRSSEATQPPQQPRDHATQPPQQPRDHATQPPQQPRDHATQPPQDPAPHQEAGDPTQATHATSPGAVNSGHVTGGTATEPARESVDGPAAEDVGLEVRLRRWYAIGESEFAHARGGRAVKVFAGLAAVVGAVGAFVLATVLEGAFESAAETLTEDPAALTDNAIIGGIYGRQLTAEDIEGLHGVLTSPTAVADFTGVALLFVLAITLVPIAGLTMGLTSAFTNRESDRYASLEARGYGQVDVLVGTFLGRCLCLGVVVGVGGLAIALGALVQTSFPSLTLVVTAAVVFALSCIFVAFGTFAGTLGETKAKAWAIGLGLLVLPYYQLVTWLPSSQEQLATFHPWSVSPLIQRFHFGTVVTDSLVILPLSRLSELVPRVSLVTEVYIEGRSTAETGSAELASVPLYLEHWFVFVVIAFWITLPLVGAYLALDRDVSL
ncbi:ABC transporter permease subunit [Natrialbaceae archaeon A-CW2]